MRSGVGQCEDVRANSQSDFERMGNYNFPHDVFVAQPGLRTDLESGGYMVQLYSGQEYDPEHSKVVEGLWNHTHCNVCKVCIDPGQPHCP